MMQSPSRRLGEILIERMVLSRAALEELLDREANDGIPLPKLLLGEGLVSEKDLVAAIGQRAGFPFFDLGVESASPLVASMLPVELCRRLVAMPVEMDSDHLVVVMADPSNRGALAELEQAAGVRVRPAIGVRSEILSALGGPGTEAAPAGARPLERIDSDLHVNQLLARVVEMGGSDLHMTVGLPPCARVNGEMLPLDGFEVLTGSEIRRMIFAILTQRQRERFEEELELDTSHSIPHLGRFRVNVFLQRDAVGAVMRVIPSNIVGLERLGLPAAVAAFAELQRGLVLVTGPTGSGKSTTLASLIDIVNSRRAGHIMTVEDPIEFIHTHKRCVVNQREVGEDTRSFAMALKHVLRQDPDVILVGEMRDLETISTAITAAETGHLVFGTLHTQDAPQSVDRVIDVFPAHQQQQIRVQLAAALQGVVTQQLVPSLDGGRVVAAEVLVATPAVRNLIREGKTHQIYSSMQAGGKHGMQTMDMSLAALVKAGRVSMAMASERCANEEDLRRLVGER